jgi:hypothetical protein
MIRERYSKRYNARLEKQKLQIKDGVYAEFDFVSTDDTIVGQVKSNGLIRSGPHKGEIRNAVLDAFASDCLLLATQRTFKNRVLVLTDEGAHDKFITSSRAKAAQVFEVKIKREPL